MKKLSIVLLLLCVTMASNAQFRLGVKGGANYSDFSVSTGSSATLIKEVNAITTWRAGLMLEYRLQDFSFQSELMYSVGGGDLLNQAPGSAKLSTLIGSTAPNVSYRSQKLIIPLNLQYGRDLGAVHLYALAGPFLSVLVAGEINGQSDRWDKVQDEWGFNKVDLGFGFGAGAELKNLQLTLRYDLGGSEIGKKVTNSHVSSNLNPFFDMKERNLSLSLGYFF